MRSLELPVIYTLRLSVLRVNFVEILGTAFLISVIILSFVSEIALIRSLLIKLSTNIHVLTHVMIAIGILLKTLLPITMLPLSVFIMVDQGYLQFFFLIASIGSIVGNLVILMGLHLHYYSKLALRFNVLSFFEGMTLIIVTYGIVDSGLAFRFTPLEVAILVISDIWLALEYFHIFFSISKKHGGKLRYYIPFLYPIFVLLVDFVFTVSNFLNMSAYLLLEFLSLFEILSLSLALLLVPEILLTSKMKIAKILLIEKETGLVLMEYTNQNQNVKPVSNRLAGMAIVGVLQVLQEVTGREDFADSLGFSDFNLYFSEYKNLIGVTFTVDGYGHMERIITKHLKHWYGIIDWDNSNRITSVMLEEFTNSVNRDLVQYL